MLTSGMQKIDLTGRRVGRITVLSRAPTRRLASGRTMLFWHCRCDCNAEWEIQATRLSRQDIYSCWSCYRQRQARMRVEHGDNRKGNVQRLYRIWTDMLTRCRNANHKDFKNYGARGISVDLRWHSYPAFKAWALAHGYADNLTIERKDNDGNYTPDNCCWIAKPQQNRNRRSKKDTT